MKPRYNGVFHDWEVTGIGTFGTASEAREAIRQNQKTVQLLVKISPKLNDRLRALAVKKHTTVSKLVRQAIEKEVKENG